MNALAFAASVLPGARRGMTARGLAACGCAPTSASIAASEGQAVSACTRARPGSRP